MTKEELLDICQEWSEEDSRHIMVIAIEETPDNNSDALVFLNCSALKMGASIAKAMNDKEHPNEDLRDILSVVEVLDKALKEEQKGEKNLKS